MLSILQLSDDHSASMSAKPDEELGHAVPVLEAYVINLQIHKAFNTLDSSLRNFVIQGINMKDFSLNVRL